MSKVALVILITLTLTLFAPAFLALAGPSSSGDSPRLVLFPPREDGAALVMQAGGSPIGPREAPMGILAFAADNAAFDQRLRDAGAWAVIDGTAFARLCGIPTTPFSEGQET